MKQYKKPTRDQKEVLTAHGYNPSEWRYVGMVEEDHMEFVNPNSNDKEHIFLDGNKRR
jgi:hypothetical protein